MQVFVFSVELDFGSYSNDCLIQRISQYDNYYGIGPGCTTTACVGRYSYESKEQKSALNELGFDGS